MTQLPEPTAKRLQRPSWRDARLLVGVVLVLLGTVLGARLIAAADDTMTPELRALVRDPVGNALSYGSGLTLVLILILMIWKPGQ